MASKETMRAIYMHIFPKWRKCVCMRCSRTCCALSGFTMCNSTFHLNPHRKYYKLMGLNAHSWNASLQMILTLIIPFIHVSVLTSFQLSALPYRHFPVKKQIVIQMFSTWLSQPHLHGSVTLVWRVHQPAVNRFNKYTMQRHTTRDSPWCHLCIHTGSARPVPDWSHLHTTHLSMPGAWVRPLRKQRRSVKNS